MRASSRVGSRAVIVLAVASASVTLVGAASMAALIVSDVPTAIPTTVPGGSITEAVTPAVVTQPDVTGVSGADPGVTGLVVGTEDGPGAQADDPTPQPTRSPATVPQTGTGRTDGVPARSGPGGSAGDVQDVQRTGTRAPAPTNAIDRAVHLARPFAPAVVIAALGLLALGAAARGNDRLVKRGAEGSSSAGAWRL